MSFYESHGMGLQDLVGVKMLSLARERGIGQDMPFGGQGSHEQGGSAPSCTPDFRGNLIARIGR